MIAADGGTSRGASVLPWLLRHALLTFILGIAFALAAVVGLQVVPLPAQLPGPVEAFIRTALIPCLSCGYGLTRVYSRSWFAFVRRPSRILRYRNAGISDSLVASWLWRTGYAPGHIRALLASPGISEGDLHNLALHALHHPDAAPAPDAITSLVVSLQGPGPDLHLWSGRSVAVPTDDLRRALLVGMRPNEAIDLLSRGVPVDLLIVCVGPAARRFQSLGLLEALWAECRSREVLVSVVAAWLQVYPGLDGVLAAGLDRRSMEPSWGAQHAQLMHEWQCALGIERAVESPWWHRAGLSPIEVHAMRQAQALMSLEQVEALGLLLAGPF